MTQSRDSRPGQDLPDIQEILSSVRKVLAEDSSQREAAALPAVEPRVPLGSAEDEPMPFSTGDRQRAFLRSARLTELLSQAGRSGQPHDAADPAAAAIEPDVLLLTDPLEADEVPTPTMVAASQQVAPAPVAPAPATPETPPAARPLLATLKPAVVESWLRSDEGRAVLRDLVRQELISLLTRN